MGQPSLLWEAAATVIFNFFLTGVTAAAALVQPFLPGADQVALVLALVMGLLTLFAFALPGAFINPAVALTQMVQGNVKPLRFVVLAATQLVCTIAAVALVAEALAKYPLPGVKAPGPPPAHGDPAVVAVAEFALALAVFGAAALFDRSLGPVLAPFATSAFYVACAYWEAGRFSGALINPAAVLALHVYRGDLFARDTWQTALTPAAPYLGGICAASILLGLVGRLAAPKRRAKAD